MQNNDNLDMLAWLYEQGCPILMPIIRNIIKYDSTSV